MASLNCNFAMKVNVGLLFIADEVDVVTFLGDFTIDEIVGIASQMIAERKGWA